MLGSAINYLARSTLAVAAPTLFTERHITTQPYSAQPYSWIVRVFHGASMRQPVAAGVSARVRPHGPRHTAIAALLDAGAGLGEAQWSGRHADPRTLLRSDDTRADIAGEMARTVSDLV